MTNVQKAMSTVCQGMLFRNERDLIYITEAKGEFVTYIKVNYETTFDLPVVKVARYDEFVVEYQRPVGISQKVALIKGKEVEVIEGYIFVETSEDGRK